ncbi:hypothetical protein A2130_04570 [Candidatus Woesebacteria bacterium GWC2_33_12]|uniref:Uncharacterized protein n=1 Tax=Candidatus Woesebacteria bacterium GW2011_GWB1_33_22 TaxID=1618566 RepID=A0A0F9ZLF5_9BACT|nr:MAG: hypothetical protein UR29_C0005G0010 [Candidatus Woesebacteria bacterium GW2011_GWC2_33_12]KKP42317.1 MAG: hypothetical protein UR33_C0003G0010 [Candidatus Woesebacteria bacterium GW2011_GWA2_33_20]KKP45068.1 MAG: hypothetical protein UR35_C0003G0010 [Candidatus Woesebacteria bacterium GW2011_GWB1_33_22]KKP46944.1 MAG: hypothetical protein UR37_C0003G0010 [Microgenomates group bacterium GW2011_GWC1_33_28]KKP50770.1 MAG: hypothetical protein UR41_C0003G0010 [Candidatus Woesebacteria bact
MKFFAKSNFLTTLSDLFVNLSAGWFGAILILPSFWQSSNIDTNAILILLNVLYGTLAFFISWLFKDINYGN